MTTMILEKQFREIVEDELKREGLSRTALGRRMGLSPQTITNYLNGHANPSTEMMERFFEALNVEPIIRIRKKKPA